MLRKSPREAWPSIRQPYTGVTRDRVNSESTLGSSYPSWRVSSPVFMCLSACQNLEMPPCFENSSLYRQTGGHRKSQTSNKEVAWEIDSGLLEIKWVLEPSGSQHLLDACGHLYFTLSLGEVSPGDQHTPAIDSSPLPELLCSSQQDEGLGRQWWSRQKNKRMG